MDLRLLYDLGFRMYCSECTVWCVGFRTQGSGFRVRGLGIRIWGLAGIGDKEAVSDRSNEVREGSRNTHRVWCVIGVR